uniref:Plastid lipid-associated protein/fibrillin conserved domain-containing protein n=1 Tax=Pyramimonas obovata TaxID=1411642 RepID=A0A7S0MVH3_9CHLO
MLGTVTRVAPAQKHVWQRKSNTSASRARRLVVKASVTQETVEEAKTRLLKLGAISCRGSEATTTQMAEASELVAELGEIGCSDSAYLDGSWLLVMSSTKAFRSSPFFWAVGEMMGDMANFFYEAHEHQTSLFGGGIGEVVQTIDLANEELLSDCVVKASLGVPLIGWAPVVSGSGRVKTSASVRIVDETSLACTVKNTALDGGPEAIAPALNGTVVPVSDAMSAINSGAVPEVVFETKFADDQLRISQLPDGAWFVYVRQ